MAGIGLGLNFTIAIFKEAKKYNVPVFSASSLRYAEETLEIFAFMEAADESKRQGGKLVTLESVMEKAKASLK